VTSKIILATRLPRCAPGAPNRGTHGHRVVSLGKKFYDVFSGTYKVVGTTAVAGSPDVPVSRIVHLHLAKSGSGRLARTVMSDADGNYTFNMVTLGPWFVTAHDHTGEYNAVIADNIYGKPV